MLTSQMFKKYYPLGHSTDLNMLNDKELFKVSNWIKKIKIENDSFNIQKIHDALRYGSEEVKYWDLEYDRSVIEISEKVLSRKFDELKEEDMNLINQVFYYHKYKPFISILIHPKLNVKEMSVDEAIQKYPKVFKKYWKTKKKFQEE